jgi:hypothetical protein
MAQMATKQSPIETLQSLNSAAREGRLNAIDFLEKNFLLEGSNFLVKRPIKFEPWQKESVLRPVFERVERGLDTFLVGVPKKNGKSTLGSCIGTDALLLDDSYPEVYGVAGDKDQAKVVFEFTKKAFERSPALKQLVKIYRDVIERIDGNGYYRVLSSDSSGKHGRNPSCVIWDELWNQPGYDLWEGLTISPARANPFHFVITYSGYQARAGNLLWDLYSRGIAGTDPRMYTFWRSGPEANLASWITPKYLESQRLRLPDHIFRRLHFNEWSVAEGTKAFRIPSEVWTGAFQDFIPTALGASSCYSVGIDLAKFRDFTALCILRTDVEPKRVVHIEKLPHGDYVQQVEILKRTLARWGNPRALVDAGNAGTAVIEMMRARGMEVEEFTFTNASKAKIVTDLAVAFEQKKILLPKMGRTLEESRAIQDLEIELFNFEPTVLKSGNIRYEAGGAYHDDMIMALCLAHEQSERATRQPWSFVVGVPVPQAPSLANPHPGYDRWGNKDRYADLAPGDPGPECWWQRP